MSYVQFLFEERRNVFICVDDSRRWIYVHMQEDTRQKQTCKTALEGFFLRDPSKLVKDKQAQVSH